MRKDTRRVTNRTFSMQDILLLTVSSVVLANLVSVISLFVLGNMI